MKTRNISCNCKQQLYRADITNNMFDEKIFAIFFKHLDVQKYFAKFTRNTCVGVSFPVAASEHWY